MALGEYGANLELDENGSGEPIVRNVNTGVEVLLSTVVDVAELQLDQGTLKDTTTDPAANGEITRNGADIKAYTGGQVRNVTTIDDPAATAERIDTAGTMNLTVNFAGTHDMVELYWTSDPDANYDIQVNGDATAEYDYADVVNGTNTTGQSSWQISTTTSGTRGVCGYVLLTNAQAANVTDRWGYFARTIGAAYDAFIGGSTELGGSISSVEFQNGNGGEDIDVTAIGYDGIGWTENL